MLFGLLFLSLWSVRSNVYNYLGLGWSELETICNWPGTVQDPMMGEEDRTGEYRILRCWWHLEFERVIEWHLWLGLSCDILFIVFIKFMTGWCYSTRTRQSSPLSNRTESDVRSNKGLLHPWSWSVITASDGGLVKSQDRLPHHEPPQSGIHHFTLISRAPMASCNLSSIITTLHHQRLQRRSPKRSSTRSLTSLKPSEPSLS